MKHPYKESILDHYKHPHNYGLILKPDFKAKEENVFCGDSIEISLKISKGKINDARFRGSGCVISQAAASVLTDHIKQKSVSKVENISINALVKLLGTDLSPTRMKCAEISLIALKKALKLINTSI
ncbi:MAG: SUF system FeS assembly protein, NifU family [Parcubacteria group bacterium GW2011_GWC1_38_6]|nr:MAG: SUF system FeS assembly protein, NifU family [Parcubacteria group bacterium GW2011_GWC1_38_6]